MSTRTLKILGVLTLIVVGAAVVTSLGRSYDRAEHEPEPLLPALAERVNDVASITLESAERTLELARTDKGWVDQARGGYPVRFEQVKKLLLDLTEAETIEHKTNDPSKFGRLGVADPDTEEATGTGVVLHDAQGQDIASFVVGAHSGSTGARFVRNRQTDDVVLAIDLPPLRTAPLEWLDRRVINVPAASIERVTVAHPDGTLYGIVRSSEDPDEFEMIGVLPGYRIRSQGPLARIARALSHVDLQDVKRQESLDEEKLGGTPLLATFVTKDGMQIDVSVWSYEAKKWATFEALDLQRPTDEDDAEPALGSVAERVAEINERLRGWLFEVTPAAILPIEAKLPELIEPIPQETDDDAEPGDAGADTDADDAGDPPAG